MRGEVREERVERRESRGFPPPPGYPSLLLLWMEASQFPCCALDECSFLEDKHKAQHRADKEDLTMAAAESQPVGQQATGVGRAQVERNAQKREKRNKEARRCTDAGRDRTLYPRTNSRNHPNGFEPSTKGEQLLSFLCRPYVPPRRPVDIRRIHACPYAPDEEVSLWNLGWQLLADDPCA